MTLSCLSIFTWLVVAVDIRFAADPCGLNIRSSEIRRVAGGDEGPTGGDEGTKGAFEVA